MKRIAIFLFSILTLSLLFTLPARAADTYTFDPTHTYVLWHINHFGFSNPSGKWLANGTLILDQAQPQNSKVNVIIQVEDTITGIPELDQHLKKAIFFDVARYPTATFISKKVIVTGKNTAQVQGILTLRGVAKPITLNVVLNEIAINPITNKMTAGFSATTELKRSDFGITTLIPGVSDAVKIDIEAEAYKNNPSSSKT